MHSASHVTPSILRVHVGIELFPRRKLIASHDRPNNIKVRNSSQFSDNLNRPKNLGLLQILNINIRQIEFIE